MVKSEGIAKSEWWDFFCLFFLIIHTLQFIIIIILLSLPEAVHRKYGRSLSLSLSLYTHTHTLARTHTLRKYARPLSLSLFVFLSLSLSLSLSHTYIHTYIHTNIHIYIVTVFWDFCFLGNSSALALTACSLRITVHIVTDLCFFFL